MIKIIGRCIVTVINLAVIVAFLWLLWTHPWILFEARFNR